MDLKKISQAIYQEFLMRELIEQSEPIIVKKHENIIINYAIKGLYYLRVEINLNTKIMHLIQIDVTSNHQDKRHGRTLMELCENICKRLNIEIIIVLDNYQKLFYKHFGYEKISRQLYIKILKSFDNIRINSNSVFKNIK